MKMKQNLLEELRFSRGGATVAFRDFVDDFKKNQNDIFCFYEGEDGKYYNQRIGCFFASFKSYNLHGKKEVLRAYKIIKNHPDLSTACKMFFIDKDFGNESGNNDIYVTPCYSIENLYTDESCLKKILHTEFGINNNCTFFENCVDMYRNTSTDFIKKITEFNAIVYAKHTFYGDASYNFNSIKTSRLFYISHTEVRKKENYESAILNAKQSIGIEEEKMDISSNHVNNINNPMMFFRGKNCLDFFKEFIMSLKENISTLSDKELCSINLSITKNRLSELSAYAVTPECLAAFLSNKHMEMKGLIAFSDMK